MGQPKLPGKNDGVELTEAVVAEFKCPRDKVQAFLWDTEERGLGLRALPDYKMDERVRPGAKTWVLQGRIAGTSTERRVKLAELAITAQVLQNRLANMGHTGLSRRVCAASLEVAHVVVHIGAAGECPGFADHFAQLPGGRIATEADVHDLCGDCVLVRPRWRRL
jgi:hypothetical protein